MGDSTAKHWIASRGTLLVAAILVTSSLMAWMNSSRALGQEQPSFTVNSTDDAGDGFCGTVHCNLREAIIRANNEAGRDTITFAIPSAGPHTITPLSPLPAITDPVVIDALPNCSGTPSIELDGSSAGDADGLRISAGTSTVRGLVVNRFNQPSRAGIRIDGASDTVIECSYLGTDVTGTLDRGNFFGIAITGLPNRTRIGGPDRGNVISGNESDGLALQGSDTSVVANLIGTTAAGTAPLGNAGNGISEVNNSKVTIGGVEAAERNVISANGKNGVEMSLGGFGEIGGNFIGTDKNGTSDLGNHQAGVAAGELGFPRVGGTVSGSGNVISGNDLAGVWIKGAVAPFDAGGEAEVRSSYIGTDASGTSAIPNGIGVLVNSRFNTIGEAGSGNVISGNGTGVKIDGAGFTLPASAQLQANRIGTDAAGTGALGNLAEGVLIGASATGTIGGRAFGAGNKIAFNGASGGPGHEAGVVIESGTGNSVLGNSIFSNAGLGIDLAPSGVTPNDAGDADSGANGLQNFPDLTSAESSGSRITVRGMLDSKPSTTYRIELFASSECDPSGNGEGQRFLVFTDVTTDSSGHADFAVGSTTVAPAGDVITATATDPQDNTSEFSGCETVRSTAPATLELTPKASTNTVGSQHCVTAAVRDAAGDPTPDQVVRFSVTGSVVRSGSRTTAASGEATFCYQGPDLSGSDEIIAFADTNADGDLDAGEPVDVVQKTWVAPASTPNCTTSNSGQIIAQNGDPAKFTGGADTSASGNPAGSETYTDRGPAAPVVMRSTSIDALVCNDRDASIFGQALVNGNERSFRIDIHDGGGRNRDSYRIRLSSGYDSGARTLRSGHVRVR